MRKIEFIWFCFGCKSSIKKGEKTTRRHRHSNYLARLIFIYLSAFIYCDLNLIPQGTQEEWQTVFFICTGVGLAGALAFVVLGSGLEQEWARDPNLNTEFDVYFTEEGKKSHVEQTSTGEENGGLEDRKESENSVSNHTGHVNEGFNDQIQEIIGHVKLSSSFRAQVRDFDVPVRSVPDDSDESTENQIEPDVIQDGNMATDKIQDTKNGCHINGCLNSKENMNNAIEEGCKDISTFHRRTRLSR